MDVNPNGDKETQEILDEMASEAKAETAKEEPAKAEEPVVEEEPKAKVEEPKATEELPVEEEDKPQRQQHYVPLKKLTKQKDKYEAQIAELKGQLTSQPTQAVEKLQADVQKASTSKEQSDLVKSYATQHNLDPNIVGDLVEVIKSQVGLPQEDLDSIKATKDRLAQIEARENEQKQLAEFDRDFDKLVKNYPDVESKKDQLKELAFSEDYLKLSLEKIVLAEQDTFLVERKKSAEPGRGGNKASGVAFDRVLSPQEMNDLSDADFDKYSDWLATQGKGRLQVVSK